MKVVLQEFFEASLEGSGVKALGYEVVARGW